MAIRYLYLNDNPAQLNLLVEAVKGGTEAIEIVASQADSFDRQLKHLTDVLGQYDGLLLDWRLNNRGERHAHRGANNGKSAWFHATTLVEEIRDQQALGKIKELPIILWTTYSKLNGFYYSEEANHDLFDYRYDEEQMSKLHREHQPCAESCSAWQKAISRSSRFERLRVSQTNSEK